MMRHTFMVEIGVLLGLVQSMNNIDIGRLNGSICVINIVSPPIAATSVS